MEKGKRKLSSSPPPAASTKVAKCEETTPEKPTIKRVPPSIAVDIDTHGWRANERKVGFGTNAIPYVGESGQFGHRRWCDPVIFDFSRIVKLAWQITDGDSVKKEERLISSAPPMLPNGLSYNGITDKMKEAGEPISFALSDFMADLKKVIEDGGRLVAHNIEFDAGIIYAEVKRLVNSKPAFASEQELKIFASAAKNAFCTMNKSIQHPRPTMPNIEQAYEYLMQGKKLGRRQGADWRAEKAAEMYNFVQKHGMPGAANAPAARNLIYVKNESQEC